MKFLLEYDKNTNLRALIKLIPKGNAIDFWLSEIAKKHKEKKIDSETIKLISSFNEVVDQLKKTKFIQNNLSIEYGPSSKIPSLIDREGFELSKKQKKDSIELSKVIKSEGKPDDLCGAIFKKPFWQDDPLHFEYSPFNYSEILTLRKEGRLVSILSSNSILFCEENNCILAHRRSEKVTDYPNTLHTFGGAFIPKSNRTIKPDLGGINEGARREALEETGLSFIIPENTPLIVIDEHSIQYIQVSFLGINISKKHLANKRESWEGQVVEIPFNELEDRMKSYEGWTPSGWTQIISWLALNCPNSKNEIQFNKKKGRQLAIDLINYVIAHESSSIISNDLEKV